MADEKFAISNGTSWHNIPADGEVWNVDGKLMLAYQSDAGGPYVYYEFPDQDAIKTAFPDGPPESRQTTQQEINKEGAIRMGSTLELRGDLGETWDIAFSKQIERQVDLNPWLEDPEVVAVMLARTLEGQPITKADLESTEYFKDRRDSEIDYIAFAANATDDELQDFYDDTEFAITRAMQGAGIVDPPQELIDTITELRVTGKYTEATLEREIFNLADPSRFDQLDPRLQELTDGQGLRSVSGQRREVQRLVEQWLGPQNINNFSSEWYDEWANKIASNPNASTQLIDLLQGQRLSLYPEYTNPNLTYQDISGVWQGRFRQEWGRDPVNDSDYAVLDKVIRSNDAAEAGKILRREGINRGEGQVVNDMIGMATRAFGGQVVRGF